MATIAELLQAANRKIAHLEQIKTAMKSAINGSGSTVGDKFADYPPAVTNGRAGIAAAITEKGVQTPAEAPFDVLAGNIRTIESGVSNGKVTIVLTKKPRPFGPSESLSLSLVFYDQSAGAYDVKSFTYEQTVTDYVIEFTIPIPSAIRIATTFSTMAVNSGVVLNQGGTPATISDVLFLVVMEESKITFS